MANNRSLCCNDSLQLGEYLPGTAPRSDVWLLLENPAPWGAEALQESRLPEAVKAGLSGWLKAIPNARLQFIKQDGSGERRLFYVALARTGRLYRFELDAYENLLALDIPALVGGAADYESHRSDERLFLACTNGKRDACCAVNGLPLYHKLRDAAGDAAWQSSHIGGHRFAGTFVCLPHGLYYGRVDDPAPIVAAYRKDEFYTVDCRGRCTIELAAQSAEIYLREQTGLTALDALRLAGVQQNGQQWTARFEAEGAAYVVQVCAEPALVLENCADTERKQVMKFHPAAYEAV
ncbi:MAG: sucrase ferredoxin [Chloroflexi bacterium]|nr:sucrase ferredoxin [Chloroflexota bacterium]